MIDGNVKIIYKVNVLSIMRLVQILWKNMAPRIMKNCWRHTKIE